MTADRPLVLLWIHEVEPYREAMARAGLADRVEVHTLRLGEPAPELLARCEAMLAWRVARRRAPRSPAPALDPGADGRGRGLARPARPARGRHAHLRARDASDPDDRRTSWARSSI